mmetsp:Transcript_7761/g.31955  ORF Transcript_7761/g.31955 Transcript_7761/m.31955 type:complete len:211 (+) Transcript_7761:404-1036(+)
MRFQKVVDPRDARPAAHLLDLALAEVFLAVREKRALGVTARREVRVGSLGGDDVVRTGGCVVEEHGLAETGARPEYRDWADRGFRGALVEGDRLVRREVEDAVADGSEVVDDLDGRDVEGLLQRGAVDDPRDVGHLASIVGDGTGYGEAGGGDGPGVDARVGEEVGDDRLERGMAGGAVDLLEGHRRGGRVARIRGPHLEPRVGPSDVSD